RLRGKITNTGKRGCRLCQKLKDFPIEFKSRIAGNAGDIAVRPRKARHESSGNRVGGYRHNRDRCRRRFEGQCERPGSRENKVGATANDIAGEIGIVLEPPLPEVSLHFEILPLNKSVAAQLLEKRAVERMTRVDVRYFVSRTDDRNASHFDRLLRVCSAE